MTELYPLLTLDIPESQKQPIGFLEIINKQYHENINSAIYAHFINYEENGVSDLFMNSLTELIHEKSGKNMLFGKAIARCEVKTEKGRLDILISDQIGEDCILIENKIFHWLHNDLVDYWDHVKIKDEKKIGILLTPEKHPIPKEVQNTFINITHAEWIKRIMEKGLPSEISINYRIYLTDFARTIENLTKSYLMTEQTKFYFENAPQILKAQETIHSAHRFLNDQLQLIANKLGLHNYGNSMDWRNFWDADNDIDTYITIVTKHLVKGEMHYQLILELNRKDRNRYQEVENLLHGNSQYSAMRRGEATERYIHFGVRNYTITIEEMERFAEIVVEQIREDFADAFLRTVRYFYPKKNISSWEKNFSNTLLNQPSTN